MTMEVGIAFAVVVPAGVNERLFVRLIVKLVAVPAAATGTVISTGDHMLPTEPAGVVALVLNACTAGLRAVQVAVAPLTGVPQV